MKLGHQGKETRGSDALNFLAFFCSRSEIKRKQRGLNMRYKSEKEKRFDAIYQAYADDVYRVCLHITKDEKQARKIFHQSFMEFYDYFEKVNPDHRYAHLLHLIYSHKKDSSV